MVPRRKWRWQKRNARVGDIGFLCYPSKLSRPWFRPCKVTQVHSDLQDSVRTVNVAFRPRRGAALEGGREIVPVPLETMLIPVQRLCIMLPVEEQVGLNKTAAPSSSKPLVEIKSKETESPRNLQETEKELMEAVGKLQEAVDIAGEVEKKSEEEGEVVQQVPRRSARVKA